MDVEQQDVYFAGAAHPGATASDGCHYCRTNCERYRVPPDVRHYYGGADAAAACPIASGARWRGLVVAPECRCSPYDRYLYPASVEPAIAERLGGIWSPYSLRRFASLRETDSEHLVALSEAHDSGLCAADARTRAAFARDLDNLTLVRSSKG